MVFLYVCSVGKFAKGEDRTLKKSGGQKVEQLPGKIKGGGYVSKCENYGVVSVF